DSRPPGSTGSVPGTARSLSRFWPPKTSSEISASSAAPAISRTSRISSAPNRKRNRGRRERYDSRSMTDRIFNFGAGPGVLPEPVLAEAQRDLMALPGVGMSVMEISHRSKTFDAIIQGCEADIRNLAGISSDYQILFLQGGASMQFSMVPMN